MGARKKNSANARKEAKKQTCAVKLASRPTSPRKMRLIADAIRGMDVDQAINVLTYTRKEAAADMLKLLKSAINSWEQKFETSPEDSDLYIKSISIDGGAMLKRFLPAPMGRAYRIRKRSNHVNLELASRTGAGVPVSGEETEISETE